ncbi:hypothetical protein VBD025_01595 [Virgibacillus flavescens]|uniref:hypothetical protein n=1 Tax=Virgibacillus flavescens TaxID=1611422 RepID=UPI003D343258
MHNENQLDIAYNEDNELGFNNIGRMNMNDFLFMLAGVASIAAVTVLLAWMII